MPGADETLRWFAVRLKSNFEKKAAVYLEHRNYEVFLPLYESRRRWSDRTKVLQLPLFPGYLFCRMDVNQRAPVITAPGIVSIVGLGKTPEPIPEHEIAGIQSVLREGLLVRPWPFLQTGQKVLIESGPLAGIEGILTKIKTG